MRLTDHDIRQRAYELLDNHLQTGGCAARGKLHDPCFICRAVVTMVVEGKPVEPDVVSKPLDLDEQRAIHKADCLEVKGREFCGYECADCGLCAKLSHSRHKAAPCTCPTQRKDSSG